MSTHDTMLAALKAAEPVLSDIDRHLRAKHPAMQTLEALATVRVAIAQAEPTEQRPRNCSPGFCLCIECPYHGQPRATSCECSK
jgi:hypothetical protein